MEGPPALAVEIVSPLDRVEEVHEKVQILLDSSIPLVWVVDPLFRTILVLRPKQQPELFTDAQEITAEPHLPGFRAEVRRFFD